MLRHRLLLDRRRRRLLDRRLLRGELLGCRGLARRLLGRCDGLGDRCLEHGPARRGLVRGRCRRRGLRHGRHEGAGGDRGGVGRDVDRDGGRRGLLRGCTLGGPGLLGSDGVGRGVRQPVEREPADPATVGCRRGEHGHGAAAQPGQDGVGVDLRPRLEHERPLVGARVRQLEVVRDGGERPVDDEVDVERARPPVLVAHPAVGLLDRLAGVQQVAGRQARAREEHGVEVVGLVGAAHRRRTGQRGDLGDLEAGDPVEVLDGVAERLLGVAEVRPEREDDVDERRRDVVHAVVLDRDRLGCHGLGHDGRRGGRGRHVGGLRGRLDGRDDRRDVLLRAVRRDGLGHARLRVGRDVGRQVDGQLGRRHGRRRGDGLEADLGRREEGVRRVRCVGDRGVDRRRLARRVQVVGLVPVERRGARGLDPLLGRDGRCRVGDGSLGGGCRDGDGARRRDARRHDVGRGRDGLPGARVALDAVDQRGGDGADGDRPHGLRLGPPDQRGDDRHDHAVAADDDLDVLERHGDRGLRLVHGDVDRDDLRVREDGGRDPLGHRLDEVGGRPGEDRDDVLGDAGVAHRQGEVVAARRGARVEVEHDVGLEELAVGLLVLEHPVVARGAQAGEPDAVERPSFRVEDRSCERCGHVVLPSGRWIASRPPGRRAVVPVPCRVCRVSLRVLVLCRARVLRCPAAHPARWWGAPSSRRRSVDRRPLPGRAAARATRRPRPGRRRPTRGRSGRARTTHPMRRRAS